MLPKLIFTVVLGLTQVDAPLSIAAPGIQPWNANCDRFVGRKQHKSGRGIGSKFVQKSSEEADCSITKSK